MQLTINEAIKQIQEVYRAQYDPGSSLDVWDQLLACESVAEVTPIRGYNNEEKEESNGNVNVSGNDNGACKLRVNAELTLTKQEVIAELEACNYRTSPKKISSLLEKLFSGYETTPGWWLYVAQHWPPRRINRVINMMIKQHQLGLTTIRKPAAYFTELLKFRKMRKCFRPTNGSRKQHNV